MSTSLTASKGPTIAALLIKTWIFSSSVVKSAKAASTWVLFVMSVAAVKTSVFGNFFSMEALVSRSGCSLRPRRAIRDAPASAK